MQSIAYALAPPPDQAVTLRVAIKRDPGALNPAVTTSCSTRPVTDQNFNRLVGLDQQLNPVPEFAERWTIQDRRRAYRFDLRHDVRWHDGTPFTSADVKFTFGEALLKYHSRTRAALEGLLEGVATPDPHTAIFRLRRPTVRCCSGSTWSKPRSFRDINMPVTISCPTNRPGTRSAPDHSASSATRPAIA